jgi:hypothetical protein
VVRNLYVNFLFKKEGTRVNPESENICLAAALTSAEALKAQGAKTISLSQVSFPFWIVQTSSTKSIVITATSSLRKELHFSEMKGASEVRRIISSDMSQATDIPSVVSRIEPLIESVDSHVIDISSLSTPTFIKAIGNFVNVSDPTARPNRIDMTVDSAAALKRTEEFRKVSEASKLRIDATEDLQKLVRENFGAQTTILENITKLEQDRGFERVRTMEERTNQEIEKLTKNRDDKLYELREKHTMNLRAMTADFSRAVNDLEKFFTDIVDEIRNARSQIGQKEADTEGAISVYSDLISSLKNTVARSQQPIDTMDGRKAELQRKVAEAETKYESDKAAAEAVLQAEIVDRQRRIEEARNEMDVKRQELENLKGQVGRAINKTEQSIESRVLTVQQEFLDLMTWTLENNSVRELAPLTLLDIHTYVAKYDDGSHRIINPSYTPEENFSSVGRGNTLNNEFDEGFSAFLDDLLKNDQSFKDAFERACVRGNMFLDSEAEQLLVGGLEDLLRRRLMQRDEIERLLTIWSRYSGKCPKCGTVVEVGSQFCQKCGLELAM